jgi:hypothetical protein
MSGGSGAAGLAALSLCESVLLSLTENGVIDAAEARGILEDAAAAHRGAAPSADGDADDHLEAAALIERILAGGNSVRRGRDGGDGGAAAPPMLRPIDGSVGDEGGR